MIPVAGTCGLNRLAASAGPRLPIVEASVRQHRGIGHLPCRANGMRTRKQWQLVARAMDGSSEAGASVSGKESERSSLVNEEVVLFLFQLQLDTELQRALNYEAFEAARDIRARREQVDKAVASLQDVKGEGSGAKGAAQVEVADVTSQGVRLRSELQKAVDDERYADAAEIRDRLNELEAASRKAAESASEVHSVPQFRLGKRVKHMEKGYSGVVCGWDVQCCESTAWQADNSVDGLIAGLKQPFYHVLVDEREWSPNPNVAPVAYVPEEYLTAPELEESTWIEMHGEGAFKHPFATMLFLGTDAAGDLIPCQQLRSKYNAERRDVYPPGDGDDDPDNKLGEGRGDSGPQGPNFPGIDMDSLR
ncbi:unnamed protein product [Ostreobium quekettii]|uniref:Hemimethylated DNA-binding domain-containing protein n=1 Tax=Ostreobium quekettii TaxID=121088 RepID=A0A8S1IPP3_9CHLO|nr:unnamed protein product [Ostreobium quekettii]|eukprot:evm.model.scf_239.5 EVM.evm.TU.scf_239.5   scf_239:97510-102464(-)